MSKYIDTHAHLSLTDFTLKEIATLKQEALAKGVEKIIIPGTSIQDSQEILNYADQKHIFVMAGIHPLEIVTEDLASFLSQIKINKIVAIGEIGLDYHYPDSPSKAVQIKVFKQQLLFAKSHNLPVVIHMRDAVEDLYKILSNPQFKPQRFLLHTYSANQEWAQKFLKLGAFFSFSGVVTFKNAQMNRDVALMLPLERIMTETDTPYLSPVPIRGSKNKPVNVKYVADFLAALRPEADHYVLEQIWNNAHVFFKLK